MDQPLVIELVHQTRAILDSIQKVARQSRGKFIDQEFGQFVDDAINSHIEKADLLLDCYLNYVRASTPVAKKDSVNTIIEEMLRKHQSRIGEKKARVYNRHEQDLPEIVIPDEQLRFVVDSLLQYALTSISSGGNVEVSTRSPVPGEPQQDRGLVKGNGKVVEIKVAFTDYRKSFDRFTREVQPSTTEKDVASDLLLRLVRIVVQGNQGAMECETDEAKLKKAVLLKFPVERRKPVNYRQEEG